MNGQGTAGEDVQKTRLRVASFGGQACYACAIA
jgi:hypothetical protein